MGYHGNGTDEFDACCRWKVLHVGKRRGEEEGEESGPFRPSRDKIDPVLGGSGCKQNPEPRGVWLGSVHMFSCTPFNPGYIAKAASHSKQTLKIQVNAAMRIAPEPGLPGWPTKMHPCSHAYLSRVPWKRVSQAGTNIQGTKFSAKCQDTGFVCRGSAVHSLMTLH